MQHYVYTLVNDSLNCGLGTYANFQDAYERLEEHIENGTIIDLDLNDSSNIHFEVIQIKNYKFGKFIKVYKYSIYMELLTIFPTTKIIEPSMLNRPEYKMKRNNKYKTSCEVI